MKSVTSATALLLSGNAGRLSLLCNAAAAGSLTTRALPAAAATAACTASRGLMQSTLQQQRMFATSGSSAGGDGPGGVTVVTDENAFAASECNARCMRTVMTCAPVCSFVRYSAALYGISFEKADTDRLASDDVALLLPLLAAAVFLVFGATGGIGSALARRLASQGQSGTITALTYDSKIWLNSSTLKICEVQPPQCCHLAQPEHLKTLEQMI
jgi:hypothetical protein